jgi:predicted metal-dependent peptidase
MEPHVLALSTAKIQLMSRPNSIFFTTICLSLKHVWDNTVPTAYTNGRVIGMNPDYFMSLTPEQRIAILLHETMHVAFFHILRLKTFHHRKWNIAADHVINLLIKSMGYRIPSGWYADEQYAGMSSEEVYNLLPEPDPTASGNWDLREPPEDAETIEKEIQEILVRAAIQSKIAGNAIGLIPGEIQLFLDKLLKPQLPWNRILQRFMTSMNNKNDYSFTKPNRRHFPNIILPGLYSKKLTHISVAVDTSGSVSKEDFTAFISEVRSILRVMRPQKLTLVQFDTSIGQENRIRNLKELSNIAFNGGGGTHIGPVIEWANENKPNLLLIFTDGYFREVEQRTKVPLIWLIHNNEEFTAPQGKVIHYENIAS